MSELKSLPVRRKRHHLRRRSTAVIRPLAAAPPASIDWSAIFSRLPQEPPKTFTDALWNSYKDNGWVKYRPEGRLGFELARIVARDPDTPESVKILANILAGIFVFDGLNATAEGLRRDEARRRVQARIGFQVYRLPPA